MTDAYAAIYTALLPRLAACDLEDCARRVGFSPPVNGILHVSPASERMSEVSNKVMPDPPNQRTPNGNPFRVLFWVL
ncbi:hypothetical protein LJC47_06710 [Desulfosarcina sp. OttesenSCG-928-B08]|nr:hypothetical protein [Desulfosarcina sp. OttesenSCG-928-B08]